MKIIILWLSVLPALVACFGNSENTTQEPSAAEPEPIPTDVRSDFSASSSTYEMTGAFPSTDSADTMSSGAYTHEHE